MRHEDAVVAAELQEKVVARDPGHRAGLDAGEPGDAVVLVDHVVARTHVEEGGEPRAGREAALTRRRADECPLVDDDELETLSHEAVAQRRGEEVEAGARLAEPGHLLRRDHLGRDVAQPVRGALGLALVAEDDEHAVVVVDQADEVALGAPEIARRELRPRGSELHGLVALHHVEMQRLGQQRADPGERRVEPLAEARARHRSLHLAVEVGERAPGLVRVEDGPAEPLRGRQRLQRGEPPRERGERAHARAALQLLRRLLAALALPVGHGLTQPGDVLGLRRVRLESGEHRGGRGFTGRPLGVDRERAQALDLVAPELHAQRIPERRVRVDEAAAHGELATATDLLDALVAEFGEACHGGVEVDLRARREVNRPGLELERQEPLEQGHGLGDDDSAGAHRGERLLALADHVRRRRHVRPVQHAASGQHRHRGIQVHREVGGEARGGLAVRRDHHAAAALLGQGGREHVRRVEARGVRACAAPQPRRGGLERLVLSQVLEEHERPPPGPASRSPETPRPRRRARRTPRAPHGGGAAPHSSRCAGVSAVRPEAPRLERPPWRAQPPPGDGLPRRRRGRSRCTAPEAS